MKKFQPPRGTRDYLPEDMVLRRKVFEACRRVFERYGYGEICTPAFEDFELLAKKSGPGIGNELYVFRDKSGRKLGLRFDPTVPIARVVSLNPNIPKPIKFYYLTNMWRYDRPQLGRWREFWQAGVELIGSPRPEADAEVIELVSECLKAIGVKGFYFKVNSRAAVERLAREAGVPGGRKLEVFRAIDKLSKIGVSGVRKELERSVGKKSAAKVVKLLESGAGGGDEIVKLLKQRRIRNVETDLSIVRGIDYYTGFVFETFVKGSEKLGSVASGGRYDSLIGIYGGGEMPATGFGLGIDRIMEIIGTSGSASPGLFVVNVNKDLAGEAASVAARLRRMGVACETDLMGRSLRKQLEYANSKSIPFAVFVGKKEMKSGKFTLRDMKSGKESFLTLDGIMKRLS